MSELSAITCKGCGGTVRLAPGKKLPSCMFCGADAQDLVPAAPPEGIEDPVGALPFAVDHDAAVKAFEAFATSSFWYPSDLRSAKLEMRALLLPAWAWSGQVETHWTGLESANTRSGKRPRAGRDTVRFHQILVPASKTLRLRELAELGPYDESSLGPLDAANEAAVELSEMTRSSARASAHHEMLRRHSASISASHGLRQIKASSLATELEGQPVLVPVWIGAYRYGSTSYRILVHGQSAKLVGDAPTSWWKIAGVVLAILAVLAGLLMCITGGTGFLAILSAA